MANIKEKDLPVAINITASDFIRIVTSGGSSQLAPVSAIANDYVVEQGTSGNWIYRKWSKGTFEAWITSSHTGSITSQSGSFYYLNGSLSLPSIGISTIKFASIEYYGPELTFSKLGNVSTTAIGFTFISSVSRPTAVERTYFAYVIGTYS